MDGETEKLQAIKHVRKGFLKVKGLCKKKNTHRHRQQCGDYLPEGKAGDRRGYRGDKYGDGKRLDSG